LFWPLWIFVYCTSNKKATLGNLILLSVFLSINHYRFNTFSRNNQDKLGVRGLKLTTMAELEITSAKNKHGKKLHKKSTRVDLTPMVDLGFLLLTFFVFTTAMTKPTAMNLVAPNDEDSTQTPICETCVLTVMLDDNDKIFYYEGMPESNPVIKETSFTTGGIRKVLLQKLAAVKAAKGTADDMVLIIKSGESSDFKNFVDMADEVTINNIKHYFIDEMNGVDRRMLSNFH
jgi:biopolymer transport protein ExbD